MMVCKPVSNCFFLCILAGLCLLSSCRSYQFLENGFIVDGDGVYHNPGNYAGIGLFGDFVNYKKNERLGTRFDRLYPSDHKVLKSLGYGKGDVDILFSGTPDQPPYYHLVGVAARSGLLDTTSSIIQYTAMGKYHYRKIDVGKHTVLEAIIRSGEKNYALIYYAPKGESMVDFEHLLAKNVHMPNRPHNFLASKTEVNCDVEVQKNVDIKIPQKYVNREIYTLIKVLKKEIYGESLTVYTLNRKNVDPQVVFKLCPGTYRIVYSDLRHEEIWSQQIDVM